MKNAVKILVTVLALVIGGVGTIAPAQAAMMMRGHHGKCMMHSSHGKCMVMHGHKMMMRHHMMHMMKKY